MKRMSRRMGRAIAATSIMGMLAAGCAANRKEGETTSQKDRDKDDRRAADTVYYPGTGEEGGGAAGGAGEPTYDPGDPTATDTAGVYGDPNGWPTGPLPGDTGVGGAGTPIPDTVWMDTSSPSDTFGIPEDQGRGGMPGGGSGPDGGTGPDVW